MEQPNEQALTQRITREIEPVLAEAQQLVISDATGYQAAARYLTEIKAKIKTVEEERTAITGPLNDALRRANDFFRPFREKLESAERNLKAGIARYEAEERRKQQEEQRRRDEEARRERERLEAEARETERKAREAAEAERRKAEEARRREEAARREAEEARKAGDAAAAREAEKAARAAAAAAAKAETREAATLERAADKVAAKLDQAANTVAEEVQDNLGARGIASREVWRYEITDESALPREFLVPDQAAIGAMVNKLQARTRIPGVRVYSERVIAAQARRGR